MTETTPAVPKRSVIGDFAAQLRNATVSEEIFRILDQSNHKEIVKRLRYLHDITPHNDPDDPDMELDSLRELALFLTADGASIPHPEIGITPEGTLQLEWYSGHTSALMDFRPDGTVQFARISDAGSDHAEQSVQGIGSKQLALQSILPFISCCPSSAKQNKTSISEGYHASIHCIPLLFVPAH